VSTNTFAGGNSNMKIQGTSSKSPIGRRKEFDLTNKASVDFTRTSDTMAYANTTR